MEDGSCEGCFYAVPTVLDDDDVGMKCHRYPPTIVVYEGEMTQVTVDAINRCGEYKKE